MRIVCIGGGPAGLYFAILMKKARPAARHHGVRAQSARRHLRLGRRVLRRTRSATAHRPIRRRTARSCATSTTGTTSTSSSRAEDHVQRPRLLRHRPPQAAQHSAGARGGARREAGVRDRGRRRRASFADADLIVAADGVNSTVRRQYAEHFQPDIDVRKCRYIWLGSHRKLDAFTFAFEETPLGLVPAARLPLRRGHQHLHRRDAARRPGARPASTECDTEGIDRLLREAVRQVSRRPSL